MQRRISAVCVTAVALLATLLAGPATAAAGAPPPPTPFSSAAPGKPGAPAGPRKPAKPPEAKPEKAPPAPRTPTGPQGPPGRPGLRPAEGQFVPADATPALKTTLRAGGTASFGIPGVPGLAGPGRVLAVALSVEATAPRADGRLSLLTADPADAAQDAALRFTAGANARRYDVVRPAANGRIGVHASAATGVEVRVRGYYTAAKADRAGGTFVPLDGGAPVLDGKALAAHGSVTATLAGNGGLPRASAISAISAISAVAVSVEADGAPAPGCVTAGPEAGPRAATTSLCYRRGGRATALDTLPLSRSGQLVLTASSRVRLTLRLRGYYTTPSATEAGATYVPVDPRTVLRARTSATAPSADVSVAGTGGVGRAEDVVAAVVRPSVTGAARDGCLTLAPGRSARRDAVPSACFGPRGDAGGTDIARLSRSGALAVATDTPASVTVGTRGYFRKATAPHAPERVRAVAGPGRATVSWTPPAADGGAAVTGYTVTADPGGATVRTDGQTSAVLGGLTDGKSYAFTVTAHNAAGQSGSSDKSERVTPGVGAGATAREEAPPLTTDVTATLTVDGPEGSLATTAAGQSAVFTYAGTAGRRVFTGITKTTGSSFSSAVVLTSPSGTVLARTSTAYQTQIDTMTLPATGTYTLKLTPDSTGQAAYKVRVTSVPDDAAATTTIDGPAASLALGSPGQRGTVTFQGTAGTDVFVRLSASAAPDWTTTLARLVDPAGNQVTGSMASSDATKAYIPRFTLSATGTYKLAIGLGGSLTGTVSATVTKVPADQVVAAAVDDKARSANVTFGQAARFTFTGTAGTKMHAATTGPGGPLNSLTLLEPGDTMGASGTGDLTAALTKSGTYTLYVSPKDDQAGTVTATLGPVPPDVTVPAVIGGPEVTAATTGRWQSSAVTFDGKAGQRLTISCATTPSDAASFTLLNPSGNWVVNSSACPTAGPAGSTTALLDRNGTYRLEIQPSRTTAARSVRIKLTETPAPVAVTAVVDGPVAPLATSPGQAAEVRFDATAGQRVLISCTASAATTRFVLYDPSGAPAGSSGYCYVDGAIWPAVTLAATGTYKIAITSPDDRSASMGFRVRSTLPVATAAASVDGDPVTVNVTKAYQDAQITFAGKAGQRVAVDCVKGTQYPDGKGTSFTLLDPSGTNIDQKTSSCDNPTLFLFDARPLNATGTYTVYVSPPGDRTGGYTVKVLSVPDDVTGGTVSIGGGPVTIATTKPGQHASVTFTANAGDRIYATCYQTLTGGDRNSWTNYTLSNPVGEYETSSVCNQPVFPLLTWTLPPTLFDAHTLGVTGTHTIAITPGGKVTTKVTIQLYRVPPDIIRTTTLNSAPITVTTTAYGQAGEVSFNATAGQRVFITCDHTVANANGGKPMYVLKGPDGAAVGGVAGFQYCEKKPVLFDTQALPTDGTYTLWIKPRGLMTGTFTVRLYSPPADVTATAVPGGPAVNVATTTPGQKARVTFAATAGQRLFVTCSQTLHDDSGLAASYRLVTPSGAEGSIGDCASPPILFDTQTLATDGTYTIAVSPPGAGTADVTLRLYSPPADAKATAAVDGPETAVATTVPGQKASVTFPGTTGRRIFISCAETLTDRADGFVNYVLSDPSGNQVQFGLCATPPKVFDTTTLPADGTYTLSAAPPGIATGTLKLRVYSVPDDVTATATIGGPDTTVTTTGPGQKATVTFTGKAGQKVDSTCSQTLTDAGGSPNDYMLLDPTGSPIAFGDCSAPPKLFDTQTLPADGTYTVVITPPGIAKGTFTLRFR
ncbi:fibronectin type III domain-containing protein [Streptomyces sp. NPDC037389]|uniref:fibronectin type III domain-containing protein n=1 Tax=Streptomyces sp. NPDC037389 TaxID=3155369 RepID=UPI0033F30224